MYVQVLQTLRSYWPGLVFGLLLLRALYRRYLHPLHAVPGPFLGSITSLWFLAHYLGNKQQHLTPIQLHAKYGPLVRIRPNTVLINDPNHFGELFGWPKSEFFLAFRVHPTIIPHGNDMELEGHNVKKKKIMGGFSMSQVLKKESSMDKRVMEFLDQLAKNCNNSKFDIAPWTQFATFDIAMEMVFSNPVGFIKAGYDINGIITNLHDLLTFVGLLGLYPWVTKLLFHPWVFALIGPKPTDKTGPGAFQGFTYKQVARRLDQQSSDYKPQDILQWILDHPDKNGEHMSRAMIEQEMFGVALAASDTTAGTVRGIILGVASSPRILAKLRQQIDTADANGLLSTPPTYEQMKQHIPYLEILFKEAQRTYPIVGIPLFRRVPTSGALISGYHLPAGTEAGLSQYAVGHNPRIHGEDVTLFRPERWTEDLSHDPAAQKRREQSEVWFSGGPTLCTGRNVATLEVYKIITQFFMRFDMEVVNTLQPWKAMAEVAIVHSDFFVKLTERKRANGVESSP